MKTKVAYVLTSDSSDYYLEQSFLSVYSCRLHNPNVRIVLATDAATVATCNEGIGRSFLENFDEIILADTDPADSCGKRSRFIKTSLRNLIEGDYLFIDSDTIVCAPLDEIDECQADLAMVLDIHTTLDKHIEQFVFTWMRKIGSNCANNRYFNSGVTFVRDTPEMRDIFSTIHRNWQECANRGFWYNDQGHLYMELCRRGVKPSELPGQWNCQITHNGLPFLKNARIIHYFAGGECDDHPYMLGRKSTWIEVRNAGRLTDNVIEMICNAKIVFDEKALVMSSTHLRFTTDGIYDLLCLTKNRNRFIYKYLQAQAYLWLYLGKIVDIFNGSPRQSNCGGEEVIRPIDSKYVRDIIAGKQPVPNFHHIIHSSKVPIIRTKEFLIYAELQRTHPRIFNCMKLQRKPLIALNLVANKFRAKFQH